MCTSMPDFVLMQLYYVSEQYQHFFKPLCYEDFPPNKLNMKFNQRQKTPEKIGKNFKIIRKIDEGTFGRIYEGINQKTNIEVAIKFEIPHEQSYSFLADQFKIYEYLHKDHKVLDKGIPNVYILSKQGEYNVLVMDLMGPSIQTLFEMSFWKFSLKTVLMLIDQMITRIEFCHSRKYVHRDLKPDNFCMGIKRAAHKLYLIDFGLAKKYIRNKQDNYLVGTARYVSINTHLGMQPSRRDDMETIGYVVMYLLRGTLPWQGIKAKTKSQKYEKMKEKKMTIRVKNLCNGYPKEFENYINQCRSLEFDEKPDYAGMRKMFKDLFQRLGYTFDYQYDWIKFNKMKEKADRAQKDALEENSERRINSEQFRKADEQDSDEASEHINNSAGDKVGNNTQENVAQNALKQPSQNVEVKIEEIMTEKTGEYAEEKAEVKAEGKAEEKFTQDAKEK